MTAKEVIEKNWKFNENPKEKVYILAYGILKRQEYEYKRKKKKK